MASAKRFGGSGRTSGSSTEVHALNGIGLHLAVDTGGTFTDVVAARAGHQVLVSKVPTDAENPARSFMVAIESVAERLGLTLAGLLERTGRISHGTTLGVNALLQDGLARTALLTTEGFRDALEIRRSRLENQWDLRFRPPEPSVPRYLRLGIRERIDWSGRVLTPLDEEQVREVAAVLRGHRVEAVALCFLFSYLNPAHEQAAAAVLRRELPEVYVSASSEVAPRMGEYERTSTVVLNAALGPLFDDYLTELGQALGRHGWRDPVHLVLNSGVLNDAVGALRAPVKTLFSGPAGGSRGAETVARQRSVDGLIVADMGGTSFDTHLVLEGRTPLVAESAVAGHPLALPMVDIHSIAAGGGSVLSVDEAGAVRVGPRSAGALPGPACYGRGGVEPTLTDAALVLGLLDPAGLLGGRMPLDADLAWQALDRALAGPLGLEVPAAAFVAYRVAAARMADAIRLITVQRGIDPGECVLLGAGGAFPLFATAVAEDLAIEKVLLPAVGPTWCAWGMVATPCGHEAVQPYLMSGERWDQLGFETALAKASAAGHGELARLGVGPGQLDTALVLEMRYADQHHAIDVRPPAQLGPGQPPAALAREFHARHETLFGYCESSRPWQLLGLRLSLREKLAELPTGGEDHGDGDGDGDGAGVGLGAGAGPGTSAEAEGLAPAGLRQVVLDEGGAVSVPVWGQDSIGEMPGPCLVKFNYTTAVVSRGYVARLASDGILELRRKEEA